MDKETKDKLISGAAAGGTIWAGTSLAKDIGGDIEEGNAWLAEGLGEDRAKIIRVVGAILLGLSWAISGTIAFDGGFLGFLGAFVICTALWYKLGVYIFFCAGLFVVIAAILGIFGIDQGGLQGVLYGCWTLICPYHAMSNSASVQETAMLITSGFTVC